MLFLISRALSSDFKRDLPSSGLGILVFFYFKQIFPFLSKNVKKSVVWKKDVLDAQIRDRLTMGGMSKDDSVEQMKSYDSNVLSHFNDEQTQRNVSHISKALKKDGLCVFVFAF